MKTIILSFLGLVAFVWFLTKLADEIFDMFDDKSN